ncbi:uncharacterized protein LOC129598305 [Paramacrobiotus metropolitanus]|uniref:uncharacterized protein LOC129598305 n=1 Tax=Paramacrobiotus metropolitanus TaxID=2943436 RepID=UPI0024458CE6|nr:uncharacterized protein LOC129598305 [Paramacrobiotus metropolitanus]
MHAITEEKAKEEDDNVVTVTVSEPQKVNEGLNAYVQYKVSTETNLAVFRRRKFSVVRRFSDFLGLHEKLQEKHVHVGRFVPPAPEKSVAGMAKVKMSKGDTTAQDGASGEFVERRRAALERFLARTAQHPVLRMDPDLREFLEMDETLPKASNTSAFSGAGVMRLFGKVGEQSGRHHCYKGNLPLSGLTWDVTDDLPKAGGEGPSTSGQSGAGGGRRTRRERLPLQVCSSSFARGNRNWTEATSDSRREANAAADSVKHAAGGVVQQSGRKRKASSDEGDKKRRDGGQAARAIDEPLQDRAAAAEVSQRQDKGPDAGQHGRRSHEQAEVESAQLASVSGQKVVASDEDAKGTGQETPDEHVQAADEKKEALKPDARHEPEEAADTLEHAAGDVLQQPAGEKGSDEKRREEVDESGQERATGASASATGVDQAQHAMEACRRTLVAVRDEAGTALSDAGPSQAAPVRAFAARVGVLFVSLADISSLALASSIEASDVQEGLLELAAKLEKGGASSTGGGGSVEDREQEPHGSK